METCKRSSVTVLGSLFIISIIIVCMCSEKFSSSIDYSLKPLEVSTKMIVKSSPEDLRAVQFARSSSGLSIHRFKNRTQYSRESTKQRSNQQLEQGLARARSAIQRASASIQNQSITVNGYGVLNRKIFHNPAAFYQSYTEMERRFKVYVYEEGNPPIIHDGPCKNIYTIEGRFIQEIEHGNKRFTTKDPHKAHVYFMPFSVTRMVQYLYKPLTYNLTPLRQFVSDYVKVISNKYSFWNRTHGADHFMLACHDWGPHASEGNKHLYNTSIRVLCNANTSEGFNPQKDVALPEIHLYDGNISPKLNLSLSSSSADSAKRHLAFFAGGLHGPIRPLLLRHWKNRDPNLLIYEYLPKELDYYDLMVNSKFCLCPSGHEVASPRIVEALYAGCVPVIISESYVLPFSDVLNWDAFSISVKVEEIEQLKEILMGVSEEKYRILKENIASVRRHFVLNQPAERFDVFHMILHSIWLRRINLQLE